MTQSPGPVTQLAGRMSGPGKRRRTSRVECADPRAATVTRGSYDATPGSNEAEPLPSSSCKLSVRLHASPRGPVSGCDTLQPRERHGLEKPHRPLSFHVVAAFVCLSLAARLAAQEGLRDVPGRNRQERMRRSSPRSTATVPAWRSGCSATGHGPLRGRPWPGGSRPQDPDRSGHGLPHRLDRQADDRRLRPDAGGGGEGPARRPGLQVPEGDARLGRDGDGPRSAPAHRRACRTPTRDGGGGEGPHRRRRPAAPGPRQAARLRAGRPVPVQRLGLRHPGGAHRAGLPPVLSPVPGGAHPPPGGHDGLLRLRQGAPGPARRALGYERAFGYWT